MRGDDKMKTKKIVLIVIVIAILLCVIYIIGVNLPQNVEEKIEEYTPQQEITQEQLRQTTVSLYFKNKENNTLVPESRSIDVKELSKEPYIKLINLLLEGPNDENLTKTLAEGTKVKNVEVKNNIAIINFSKEFIENHKGGAEEESATIYSIVNTLTQLNEINGIKILIDGEENKGFSDNMITFTEVFVKKD